jgi:hypothetical protein
MCQSFFAGPFILGIFNAPWTQNSVGTIVDYKQLKDKNVTSMSEWAGA